MDLIKRTLFKKLDTYLNLFPIVSIIGPRQCGKTTFAKMELPDWQYFDLEKPSDFNRISADIEFFLNNYGNKCIIDEAHNLPELFPALRNFIDENKEQKGQIILLGSVNPLLIKNISESLAGRVGIIELTPFMYKEAQKELDNNLEKYWLQGGFPKPLIWQEPFIWIEEYIKTFIERDIFKFLKTTFNTQKQNQLLTMFAHTHANLWNASKIASSLGTTYHTINKYIDLLESFFLIRKLQPYHDNIGKRLVKQPKIYLRDTGILHYLLSINDIEALRSSPYRGASFEGLIIEQLIQKYNKENTPSSKFYFYRTSQGNEIDLLVIQNNTIIPYEIKTATSIDKNDVKNFLIALDQLKLEHGNIIYFGKEDYQLTPRISVKSAFNI